MIGITDLKEIREDDFDDLKGLKINHESNRPEWKNLVGTIFPDYLEAAEMCMAVSCSLVLSDLSVCPALLLLGQPSTGKTTVLGMFSGVNVYQTDDFTPASFVSHMANRKRTERYRPSS